MTKTNITDNLPVLTGKGKKQATAARVASLKKVEEFQATLSGEEAENTGWIVENHLLTITKAGWWLDHQGDDATTLLLEAGMAEGDEDF